MNHTRKLVKEFHALNRNFPNVQGLDVRPGTVLQSAGADWTVIGSLEQFVTDAPLKARIEAAIARLQLGGPGFDGPTHDLELKSTGTTMVSAGAGGDLSIPGVVEGGIKLKVEFEAESEYYFDTADPGYWYTFSPTEMHDIRKAALDFLENGTYVVTGVAWCTAYTWAVSRKAGSKLGFSGKVDLAGIDVGKIADLVASGELAVSYDSAAALRKTHTRSVACFSCVKRKTVWFNPTVETAAWGLLDSGDLTEIKRDPKGIEVVAEATPDDVFGAE